MLQGTASTTIVLRTDTGEEHRMPATPVPVLGLEDYKFMIHETWYKPDSLDDEDEEYQDCGYSISEVECGFALVKESTKEAAIEAANKLVDVYGREECVRRIEAGIKHVHQTMKHPVWIACKDAGLLLMQKELDDLVNIMRSRGLLSERIS